MRPLRLISIVLLGTLGAEVAAGQATDPRLDPAVLDCVAATSAAQSVSGAVVALDMVEVLGIDPIPFDNDITVSALIVRLAEGAGCEVGFDTIETAAADAAEAEISPLLDAVRRVATNGADPTEFGVLWQATTARLTCQAELTEAELARVARMAEGTEPYPCGWSSE